jgi:hypothetical protein
MLNRAVNCEAVLGSWPTALRSTTGRSYQSR